MYPAFKGMYTNCQSRVPYEGNGHDELNNYIAHVPFPYAHDDRGCSNMETG